MAPGASRPDAGGLAVREKSLARAAYAVLALLALAGLGLEYGVTLGKYPGAPGVATLRYASFFTILSNALVMIAAGARAVGRGALGRWAARADTRAAISVYIVVVAVIFQLLLAHLFRFSPLGWWGNMLAHQLVPALWLVCWFVFGPHGGIDRIAPLRWLVFPLLYGGWIIALGAASGWYPYPFMDVPKRGGAGVAITMVAMALFFLGLGLVLRWIDGRLASRLTR